MCLEAVEHSLLGVQGFRLKNSQNHVEIAVLFEEFFYVELCTLSKTFDVCEFAAKLTFCTVKTDKLSSAADSGLFV